MVKSRYSKYLKLILFGGDLFLVNAAFLICVLHYHESLGLLDRRLIVAFYIMLHSGWMVSSYLFDLYHVQRIDAIRINFKSLIKTFAGFLLLYFPALYFIEPLEERNFILGFPALLLSFLLAWHYLYLTALLTYRKHGFNFRRIILVGEERDLISFYKETQQHPEYGLKMEGFFTDGSSKLISKRGKLEDIYAFCKINLIDEVYCTYGLNNEFGKQLFAFSENNMIRFRLIPPLGEYSQLNMGMKYYGQVPVIMTRKEPLQNKLNQLLKRALDLAITIPLILFVFPWLFPIIALIIKLESKGPVFFYQKRSGLNNQEFMVLKFRSMYMNSFSNSKQTSRKDKRITPFGAFLRKTSIDELPQFFNVLKGEMSVVGPRPHMISQTMEYAKLIDHFMVRHFIKPGITGLAQVKGYRGATHHHSQMENRVRYDLKYLEKWSLWLDMKIIASTFVALMRNQDNAY